MRHHEHFFAVLMVIFMVTSLPFVVSSYQLYGEALFKKVGNATFMAELFKPRQSPAPSFVPLALQYDYRGN